MRNTDVWNDLSRREQETLKYIYERFGHLAFSAEQLLQDAPSDRPPAEWHIGLVQLCRRHLIATMRKSWGERIFQMPIADFFDWYPIIYDCTFIKDKYKDDPDIAVCSNKYSLANVVLRLYAQIEQEPVVFTQKGIIHKKCMQALCAALHIAESGEEPLPGQLSGALDLGLRLGLIKRGEKRFVTNQMIFRNWLQLSLIERDNQLFRLWYRIHYPETPAMQLVTAAIRHLQDGRWVDEVSLPGTGHSACWLQHLAENGWLERGEDHQGNHYVRLPVAMQDHASCLIIQPDFEIIAFPDSPFIVKYALLQIGEWQGAEQYEHYQITGGSVRNACQHGWTGEEIVSLLQKHARYPLPDLVKSTIAEWANAVNQVRIRNGIMIEFSDRHVLNMILSQDHEAQMIQADNGLFLVDYKQSDAEQWLSSHGLIVMQPGSMANRIETSGQQSDSAQDDLQPASEPGLFQEKDPAFVFRAEPLLPALEDVLPNMEQIPRQWHTQFRHYHPSVQRQMIEQAIQWKIAVRILVEQAEHRLIPQSVMQTGAQYVVEGICAQQAFQLPIEQIKKLQLIIPLENCEKIITK